MLIFQTGDLLQSNADALVNAVNCEGCMGKGIARQFKLQFPKNNAEYVKICKSGDLRPGRLYYYKERGKMKYIEDGLNALVLLIDELKIKSVAIPALGSGNGGLPWEEVKRIILQKLRTATPCVTVYIYEPLETQF